MIKKMYIPVIDILESNKDKTIKQVLPDIMKIAEIKTKRGRHGQSYIKDAHGSVVAIKCLYFKKWFPLIGPKSFEFGEKKSTATGFNPMTKIGARLWQQQRIEADRKRVRMLDDIQTGKLTIDDMHIEQEKIKKERNKIQNIDGGFEERQEVIEYLRQFTDIIEQ